MKSITDTRTGELARITVGSLFMWSLATLAWVAFPLAASAQQPGGNAVRTPSLLIESSKWNFVIHVKAQKDGDPLNIGPDDIEIKEGGNDGKDCKNDSSVPDNDPDKCSQLRNGATVIPVLLYISRHNPTCVTVVWGGTAKTICK